MAGKKNVRCPTLLLPVILLPSSPGTQPAAYADKIHRTRPLKLILLKLHNPFPATTGKLGGCEAW